VVEWEDMNNHKEHQHSSIAQRRSFEEEHAACMDICHRIVEDTVELEGGVREAGAGSFRSRSTVLHAREPSRPVSHGKRCICTYEIIIAHFFHAGMSNASRHTSGKIP